MCLSCSVSQRIIECRSKHTSWIYEDHNEFHCDSCRDEDKRHQLNEGLSDHHVVCACCSRTLYDDCVESSHNYIEGLIFICNDCYNVPGDVPTIVHVLEGVFTSISNTRK